MSPWRMMCEWGVPGVELWSLLHRYLDKLAKKGKHIPDVAIAGGFILEDQIFKGLALGSPYFKLIGMARGPLAAAMVGKNIGKTVERGQVPVYVGRFGNTREEIFITAPELKRRFGEELNRIPSGAIGLYTYIKRLEQGLKQLMCGARKFALEYISRDDIASLTRDVETISGIKHIMELDSKEAEKILDS